MKETLIVRKPEIAPVIAGYGMHLLTGYAAYSSETAALKDRESVPRERPDSSEIILEEGLRFVSRKRTRSSPGHNLTVTPFV